MYLRLRKNNLVKICKYLLGISYSHNTLVLEKYHIFKLAKKTLENINNKFVLLIKIYLNKNAYQKKQLLVIISYK